jgi:hypothetical protein
MYKKIIIILTVIVFLAAIPSQAFASGPPPREILDASDLFDGWYLVCSGETLTKVTGTVQRIRNWNTGAATHVWLVTPLSPVRGFGSESGDLYLLPGVLHVLVTPGGLNIVHNGVFVIPSQGITYSIQHGECK